MSDEKNAVRYHAKRFRNALELNPDWAEQAAHIFFEKIKIDDAAVVASYYPIGTEIDPSPIVDVLWERGVTTCLPVVQGDSVPLCFVRWNRHTGLVPSDLGLLEPAGTDYVQPDILIVPLLAFDQRGYRLGYGKGHYDVTLAALRAVKPILAVGLAYAEQAVLLALPTEGHDQKLDLVITPQRFFDFRA